MDIGEKIKTLRKSKSKSQEALAFDIGVSRQTINKWETNKAQPNTENLLLLCSIFEVSADYFFESEPVDNDEQDIAIPVATTKSNVKLKVLIVCSVLFGLLLLICGLCVIAFGCIVFSIDTGAAEVVGSDHVGMSDFINALILMILFIASEVLLLFFIFRIKQKTTKGDMNVN